MNLHLSLPDSDYTCNADNGIPEIMKEKENKGKVNINGIIYK